LNRYPDDAFEKISALLQRSACGLGANGFSVRDQAITLNVALDSAGPLAWAFTLHCHALRQMLDPTSQSFALNDFPIIAVKSDQAPFGNEVVIQDSTLSLSAALFYLDTAMEHCICLGMQELGYSPSEWDGLPEEQKIVPVNPYFMDLQNNWISEALENGGLAEQVSSWPMLYDRRTLEYQMSLTPSHGEVSRVFQYPTAR